MRSKGRLLMAAATSAALVLVVSAGAAGTAPPDPSFAPGPAFNAGLEPTGVVVADYNGDHAPDLAVANCRVTVDPDTGEPITRSDVRVLLGDGSGGFRPGVQLPLPADARKCAVAGGDFNGDGAPDLAVAISNGQALHALALMLGDGRGGFAAAAGSPVQVGGTPTSVVAADVNHDGRPDLIAPVADANGRITGIDVLIGDGTGGFAEAPGSPVPILAGQRVSVVAADLDGDGKPDLAVANTNRNEISVLRGDGTGGFASPVEVASARRPHALAIGDINGDGNPDLAALVTDGTAVFLGDGSGNFRAAGSPVPGYAADLAVADLNGDGKADLITASGAVSVSVATGDGKTQPAAFSPFPAVADLLAIADFDGDGKIDIAGLTGGAPYWPVGPRGSVLLLHTDASPEPRAARALRRRDAVIVTHNKISAFAADGERVAVCAGVPMAWSAPGRAPVRFKTGEYGGCYESIAIAGNRVAWIESTGCGNTSCDYGVFVSKLSGGKRRLLDEQENDCGAGPCVPTGVWISQLLGAGPLIAWNDWSIDCIANCDEEYDFSDYAVTGQSLVRFYGGKRDRVRHDSAAHPLLAVGGGRMALEVAGKVVVLKPSGARVSTVPAPSVESVALSATELGVAGRSSLKVYNPATGRFHKAIALGPSATLQLEGITSRLALLRGPHTLVLVRLSDGALVSFPLAAQAAKHLGHVTLTSAGLFYTYNVSRGKAKGRIVFERTARLLARF